MENVEGSERSATQQYEDLHYPKDESRSGYVPVGHPYRYVENPKTKGSGIVCCIPQVGECPNHCEDCFFQSGRSYLEPLSEHLPNIPSDTEHRVVRMNDGNDSNVDRETVLKMGSRFRDVFYNTAIPKDLEGFHAPVVLTVNPGGKTDFTFYKLESIPKNLMFVRVRVNTWNLPLVDEAVEYYASREVPVGLVFMAYFLATVPESHKGDYVFRKRTLNSYWAITTDAWEKVMARYKYNKWVYSCPRTEGERGTTGCRFCGNCLREYFATRERMRN